MLVGDPVGYRRDQENDSALLTWMTREQENLKAVFASNKEFSGVHDTFGMLVEHSGLNVEWVLKYT